MEHEIEDLLVPSLAELKALREQMLMERAVSKHSIGNQSFSMHYESARWRGECLAAKSHDSHIVHSAVTLTRISIARSRLTFHR